MDIDGLKKFIALLIVLLQHINSLNAARHGLRPKRQYGANLYLPETFIVPEGEGDSSEWGPWSAPSECSRSCGGGVAYQTRECLNSRGCSGGDKKYFSCNIQDCPENEPDFRRYQCSQFDRTPFEGVYYSWIPYTKAPNPCELNCMPIGERFYYRHKSKVIDGTRCNDESFDVCVDGTCQAVGCDLMLGSDAKEDKCRTCQGDGSSCKTVTGLLDMDNLQVGYNDILLIPAGATNIDIKERAPSNNYLAIRNLTGFYHLNGNYRIDFPRPMTFAGTIWHYERKPQGFAAPDRLHCIGPTSEAIYLVLLSQDRNVGINYEYSVPQPVAPEEPDSYAWTFTPFEACSKSCGGGHQSRNVSCNSRRTLQQVDDSLCDSSQKPAEWQKCGNIDCGPAWIESPWSKCSKSCGDGGEQTREVVCKKTNADGIESVVEDDVCLELGNKPATVKECHMGTICPQWFISKWTPCSKLCGEGKQTRTVQCYRKEEDGKITILEDEDCHDEKPAPEQECMIRPCEGVDYITSSWSGCDACGSTMETRKVYCASKSGKVYDDKFCENREMPELTRPCVAPPCEFMWFSSQWSKCSAICGKGVQTRTVVCGMFDGDSVKKSDDETKCNADEKPEAEKECDGPEECPAQWFAGPWSDCSVKCGTGDRTRKVMCIAGNKTVETSKCPQEKILFGSESCDMGTCNEDDLMPVDTTSSPIEDDEDEEYCDEDEDYEAVSEDPEDIALRVSFGEGDIESTLTVEAESSLGTESTLMDDELMLSDSTYSSSDSEDTTDTSITEGSGDDSPISSTKDVTASEDSSSDATSESSSDKSSDSSIISSTPLAESSSTPSSDTTMGSDSSLGSSESSSISGDSSTEGSVSETTDSISSSEASSTSSDLDSSSSIDETTTEESQSTTIESSSEESSTSSDLESSTSIDETTTEESESTTIESSSEGSSLSSDLDSSTSIDETTTVDSSSEESTSSSDLMTSTESSSSDSSSMVESFSSSVDLTTSGDDSTTSGDESSTEKSSSDSSDATDISASTESSEGTESTDSLASTETPDTTETADSTDVSASTEESQTSDSTDESVDSSDSTLGLKDFKFETIDFGTDTDIWSTETDMETATEITTLKEILLKSRARKCKVRAKKPPACLSSKFGCCADNKTMATGPFDEGCEIPENCESTKHGCCSDGISPALGPDDKGCPKSFCNETLFGCCADGYSTALGNDDEGCPEPTTTMEPTTTTKATTTVKPVEKVTEKPTTEKTPTCASSEFGCCHDESTEATGPDFAGCPAVDCHKTKHGCCNDNQTIATGPNFEGCSDCTTKMFGCCPDKITPAHGPYGEGCCLESPFGCCGDNINSAQGPNYEGCDCNYSPYRCCPDEVTSATGHNYEGCGCQYSEHGCCLDRKTPAKGPDFEGCPCHTYQFGCCQDGESVATGPHNQGCHCKQKPHGCCGDNKTPAKGPNSEGCNCANSEFGCCLDGESAATGKNFEGCETAPLSPQKACSLKKDMGTCNNFTVKFFFDIEYGACSRFWYGGCDGNDNRFDSNDDCRDVCEQPEGPKVCELPKVVGPCTAYYPMWYYDSDRNMCSQFIYGGCLGNANRFEKIEDCQSQCVVDEKIPECDQPITEGECNGQFERWGYDKDRDVCRPFTYGGCKGNKNNYASEAACDYHCKKPGIGKKSCSLPKETGSCDGKEARWYFSESDNKCMPFYYSSCGGNENNFESYESCVESCPPVVVKDVCELPADIGDCQNYTANWYFDTKHQRCRQFYYGGCGGNENNFKTDSECEKRCARREEVTVRPTTTERPRTERPRPERPQEERPTTAAEETIDVRHDRGERKRSDCLLRYDAGSCHEEQIRYYYDSYYGVCSHFQYTGCEGNENNFETYEECEDFCRDAQDPCKLLPYYGRCSRDNQTRWHYDQYEQECKEFVYGGCEGNKNNFEDRRSCERACSRQQEPERRPDSVPVQPESEDDKCNLPSQYGDCYENIISYFFNPERQSCEAFYYSGCGGNENRYISVEQCERQCGQFKNFEVCQEQVDPGQCDGADNKFYYDFRSRVCKEFVYKGCEGNGNRFSAMDECESLCIRGTELTHARGREREESQPEPTDCRRFEEECHRLACPYGVLKSYEDGCTRCQCEDPCRGYRCPDDSQCSVDVSLGQYEETVFVPICRKLHKSGQCPALAEDSRCEVECHSDADCRGDHKCCTAGCSMICTLPYEEPEHHTRPPYTGGIAPPELEEVPQEEVDIDISEGGVATLKCFATGFPPPTITWKRHGIELNTNQGRFVLTSSGDLQIVQVHRTDSGVYVCVASNGIGRHVEREVSLTVSDPVESPAYIVGPSNSSILATLRDSVVLRCMAGGYPKPFVTWWRGKDRLPLVDSKHNRFEVTKDHSFVYHRLELHDLGVYTCHAYNAVGKPVSIDITLQAQGPVHARSEADRPFLKYVVDISQEPTTPRHYVPPRADASPEAPTIDEVEVPLTANILLPEGREYNTGTNIDILCEITGQPEPEVIWYKDDQVIHETDHVKFMDYNKLLITSAVPADSGRYKCYVRNRFSEAYAEEAIRVEGPYVPHGCIDNPFFANCALIVKGKYCNHHYYAKFCCKSCTLAGQLRNHPNQI